MQFRAAELRPHGWAPPQTLQIPDWCGCSTEYLPVPVGEGWWQLDAGPEPCRGSLRSRLARGLPSARCSRGGRSVRRTSVYPLDPPDSGHFG
jgi:hypothetical protein